MKIILVTTTIRVPEALRLYRAYGPDIPFLIIGDRRSPHGQIDEFCREIGLATYYSPEHQMELGYSCSDLIGFDSIQRRNIGFLEALKQGADVIISVDDDNFPMDAGYFLDFQQPFCGRGLLIGEAFSSWSGLQLSNEDINPDAWLDLGLFLVPDVRHRGIPVNRCLALQVAPAVNVKIGVAAGLWMGDPDISAADRLARPVQVYSTTELARSGFVVDLVTPTVFNSQSTAVIRDLVPAWMMLPHIGRADDIFASLICRRIMRDADLYVHFGPPFTYQQRNNHDLLVDLQNEIFMMQHMQRFYDWLDQLDLTPHLPIVDQVDFIWRSMKYECKWMPEQTVAAGIAWVEDCRKVLDAGH